MRMPRCRVVVMVALLVAACGKDEPPPEPLGCRQAKEVFDKVDAGFALLVAKTANIDKTVYCDKLQLAAKAATGLSFALFTESLGTGAKAKAATAVREHTKGLIGGVGTIADRCQQEGVAGTQVALKAQLFKARAAVDKACAE